jgi:recombination protein RecT
MAETNGTNLAPTTGDRLKDFRAYLENPGRRKALADVAANHLKADRLCRVVLGCVTRTPALIDCAQDTIFRSVMMAAELGLEAGSQLGEAYLVPFFNSKNRRKECQLIVGYRGLIALAFRSGYIQSISATIVYQGDHFDLELGLDPKIIHRPSPDVDRTKVDLITYAYCVVQLKDGGIVYDVMTRAEIDRIRSRSKSGDGGPWVSDFAEMAKKTVTRRCLKYAPMSIELGKALALDAADEKGADPGNVASEFDFLDTEGVEVDQSTGEVLEGDKKKGAEAVNRKIAGAPGESKEGESINADLVAIAKDFELTSAEAKMLHKASPNADEARAVLEGAKKAGLNPGEVLLKGGGDWVKTCEVARDPKGAGLGL